MLQGEILEEKVCKARNDLSSDKFCFLIVSISRSFLPVVSVSELGVNYWQE